MICPKCGRPVEENAVICRGCDFILDTRFLGDGILDEEHSLRPGAGGVDPASFNLADAVILGNIDDDSQSFETSDSGFHLASNVSARLYVSGRSHALMSPDAVPAIAQSTDGLRLTPFESHVLGFIDGQRPVEQIRRVAGLEESEVKTALATLADKGIVKVVGRALADADFDVDTAPRIPQRKPRLRGSHIGAVLLVGDDADRAIDDAFRTQTSLSPLDAASLASAASPADDGADAEDALAFASPPSTSQKAALDASLSRLLGSDAFEAIVGSSRPGAHTAERPRPHPIAASDDAAAFELAGIADSRVLPRPSMAPAVPNERARPPLPALLSDAELATSAPAVRRAEPLFGESDEGDTQGGLPPPSLALRDMALRPGVHPPALDSEVGSLEAAVTPNFSGLAQNTPDGGAQVFQPAGLHRAVIPAPDGIRIGRAPALDETHVLSGRAPAADVRKAQDALSMTGPPRAAEPDASGELLDSAMIVRNKARRASGPPGFDSAWQFEGETAAELPQSNGNDESEAETGDLPARTGTSPQARGGAQALPSDVSRVVSQKPGQPPSFENIRKARNLVEEARKELQAGRLSAARMNIRLAALYDATNANVADVAAELDAVEQASDSGKHKRAPDTHAIAVAGSASEELHSLYDEAQRLENAGDFAAALDVLKRGVSQHPSAAALHNRMGVILAMKLKDYAAAVVAIQRAIDIDPDNLHYRNNLGKVMRARSR